MFLLNHGIICLVEEPTCQGISGCQLSPLAEKKEYGKYINWGYCLTISNIFSAFKSVIDLTRSLGPSSEAISCNKYEGVSFSCLDFNKLASVLLLLSQQMWSWTFIQGSLKGFLRPGKMGSKLTQSQLHAGWNQTNRKWKVKVYNQIILKIWLVTKVEIFQPSSIQLYLYIILKHFLKKSVLCNFFKS